MGRNERLEGEIAFRATGQASLDRAAGQMERLTSAKGMAGAAAGIATIAMAVGQLNMVLGSVVRKVSGFAKDVITIGQEFKGYENTFKIMLGSLGQARDRMRELKNFAAATPYEIGQISKAAVLLEGLGLYDEERLRLVGDAASAMNRTMEDTVKALAGVYMGETEAIKSFGINTRIIAKKLGHEINRDTVEGLQEAGQAVEEIFRTRFAGGMKLASETVDGLLSTIRDHIAQFKLKISEMGIFDDLVFDLKEVLGLVEDLNKAGAEGPAGQIGKHIQNLLRDLEATAQITSIEMEQFGGGGSAGLGGRPVGYMYWAMSPLRKLAQAMGGDIEWVKRQEAHEMRRAADGVRRRGEEIKKLLEGEYLTAADIVAYAQKLPQVYADISVSRTAGIRSLGQQTYERLGVLTGDMTGDGKVVLEDILAGASNVDEIYDALVELAGKRKDQADEEARLAVGETKAKEEELAAWYKRVDAEVAIMAEQRKLEESRALHTKLRYGPAGKPTPASVLAGDRARRDAGGFAGEERAQDPWEGMSDSFITHMDIIEERLRRTMGTVDKFFTHMGMEAELAWGGMKAGAETYYKGLTKLVEMNVEYQGKANIKLRDVAEVGARAMFSAWLKSKAKQWALSAKAYGLEAIGLFATGSPGGIGAGLAAGGYATLAALAGGMAANVETEAAEHFRSAVRGSRDTGRSERPTIDDDMGDASAEIAEAGLAPQTINYNWNVTYQGAVVYGQGGTRDWFYSDLVPLIREARSTGRLD